jgi:hypothetical protein
MSTGKLRAAGLAISLVLAALGLGACGSGGDSETVAQPPPIPPETAGHLAKLSDRIASDLDAGNTCDAAHAADDLRVAVVGADLPTTMRSDVDAVAGRLVDEVNCPPPLPPPQPKKKDEKHGDENGFVPPGQAKHGGLEPPGKAKLKGE